MVVYIDISFIELGNFHIISVWESERDDLLFYNLKSEISQTWHANKTVKDRKAKLQKPNVNRGNSERIFSESENLADVVEI